MVSDDSRLSAWGDPDVVAFYTSTGVLDAAESAAFAAAADSLDGGTVLDIGIGAGRTSGLLAPRASHYIGVDVAAEMVRAARTRLPDLDLRVADARDLTLVAADETVDVVIFSFNGIDALSDNGRREALREIRRVLKPGGRFILSSLNMRGVSCGEVPWRPRRSASAPPAVAAIRAWLGAARHARTTMRGCVNYWRFNRLQQDGVGWKRRLMRAHEFRFVVYYANPEVTLALLEDHRLCFEAAWSNDGTALRRADLLNTTADSVYYLLRAE